MKIYINKNFYPHAIYVRCNHKILTKWLLTKIVKELDKEPCYCSQNLFKHVEDTLKFNPKVIVVDETYLKITRKIIHNTMRNNLNYHIAEQLWRMNKSFDDLIEELTDLRR